MDAEDAEDGHADVGEGAGGRLGDQDRRIC